MDVSENSGTPKSSIVIGFSIINHPFLGTPIFGNTHMTHAFPFAIDVLSFPSYQSLKLQETFREAAGDQAVGDALAVELEAAGDFQVMTF